MQRFLCLMLCTLLVYSGHALALSDEEEIRNLSKSYEETFSKQDPEALSNFWAEDSLYTNPASGVSISGRQALVEEFKNWFEGEKADKLEMKISEITFPEHGKALEKGLFRITFKDGKPAIENAFSALLVKEGNSWHFKQIRQIHIEPSSSNYEHLKELEWLIGDWIDADQDVDINTHTQWDENKNFIEQRFNLKLYDQEILNGRQLIAWDPFLKIIRSWIFDSDGGFGEGKWYRKGDAWFVKSSFTLSNGSRASSVNVYKKIDENSYTWSSEARDVDGQILPNIKPIKIVRKTP